jgi:hexosaminidase
MHRILETFALIGLLLKCAPTFGAPQSGKPPQLVPTPKSLTMLQGRMRLTTRTRIVVNSEKLLPLAAVLSHEINLVSPLRLSIVEAIPTAGDIVLSLKGVTANEAYRLTVGSKAEVTGGNYNAVALGSATLLQCMNVSGTATSLPRLEIEDQPDYSFRSVLLDLARKYHTPESIEQDIELCRLYKIRYLHLHLTDDQLFMFPSARYPQLGMSNEEFTRFEPGSKPHIQPYTLAELQRLELYSKERGVSIIPEIDLPGHSGRMIADGGKIFGIPGNGSTVNIANPDTVEALKALLNEVMDVFECTPYIHLGADEVGLDGLDRTPDFVKAKNLLGISTVHELYSKFVSDMCDAVTLRGKTPIVWEEACSAEGKYPLPQNSVVMIWSQGRNPNDVVKQGFRVVNATWTPLYIVRNNNRSPEFLFSWEPQKFGREGSTEYTTLGDTTKLMGAQLCSWENSESIEIQCLRERLAVIAEKTWNHKTAGDWAQFQERFKHTDPLLELLVNSVSITAKAVFSPDENTFTSPLKLTLAPTHEQQGLSLKYTLDNSLPNAAWQTYSGPITTEKTVYLRAGLFDAEGKQVGPLAGGWFRSAIPVKPNLATNRPVTVGPSPDRNDEWKANVAVDGRADDPMRHWASVGEAPQWLMVDLGKIQPINFINVVTYWDGGRYYQLTAETSKDGKSWKQALDFSRNTVIATDKGYSGRFPVTAARYVRVNMLKNSANPFVHIVELIVENQQGNKR